MIYVDDRIGSRELVGRLQPACLKRLEYGDFAFKGKGPQGRSLRVGIERKTVTDLIQSMCTGRLSGHQLPGLLDTYDVVYLLVEGRWRSNPRTGYLEIRKRTWERVVYGRPFTGNEIYNYLNTLEMVCGFHLFRSESITQSARWTQATYNWWTKKGFDEHRSHISIKRPYIGSALSKPSTLKLVASCLPGIGLDRAEAVSKHFGSIFEMAMADKKEWAEVEGIGKVTAEKVVSAIHRENRK